MDPQESTVANADLWTKYFRDEWSRWMTPTRGGADSPMAAVAESTAASVAGFLTLVAAGPIAWLYSANAPSVTQLERRPTDPVSIRAESPAEAPVTADSAA